MERQNISGSIIGYVTAYILADLTKEPDARWLWRGTLFGYTLKLGRDWGW